MKYLAIIPTSQRLCDYQFWQESHRRKQMLNRLREHNFTTGIALAKRSHRYSISQANYTIRNPSDTAWLMRIAVTPQGTGELWKMIAHMGNGRHLNWGGGEANVRLRVNGNVAAGSLLTLTFGDRSGTYAPAVGTHPFSPASIQVFAVQYMATGLVPSPLVNSPLHIRLLFRTQLTTHS